METCGREDGKSGSRKMEAALEGTTVRGSREEGKGRNRRLSSRNLNVNRTKERGTQGRTPQGSRKTEKGEHLSSGCGSEAGKDERKQTESRVLRTEENAWETRQRNRKKSRGTERGSG